MITEKMNAKDIIKEFKKDLKDINKHFGKHYEKCFKRQVLQSTKFPFVPDPLHFTSSRKNKYLMYIEAKKRSDWKNNKYYYVCYNNSTEYMYCIDLDSILIFPPHFFSRYRERFIKNNNITTQQVIIKYFKHNLIISIKLNTKDKTFMGSCNDGIVFGEYNNGLAIVKTFISRDMLFEKQKKLNLKLEKIREKTWKQIA